MFICKEVGLIWLHKSPGIHFAMHVHLLRLNLIKQTEFNKCVLCEVQIEV